jgi:hypothetical protein
MYISPEGGYFYFTGDNDDQVTQYSLGTVTVINFPSSVENPAGAGLLVNKRATYEFFTMDGGTTVKVIGEEMV